MNKARAMLDALMGPGRDEASKEGESNEKFKDRTCCKGYLIGMCPLDAKLLGGKRKFQVCEKIHSEMMREQLQKHPDCEALTHDYDNISLRDLEESVKECEAHIAEEKTRIRSDVRRKKPPLPLHVNDKAAQMRREASACIKKAEDLDDDNSRDKEGLIARSTEMLKERDEMLEEEMKKAIEAVVPEVVCEICGTAYIGSEGNELHLQFKIHSAYVKIRERITVLQPRVEEWEKQRKDKKEKEKGGDKSGEKDKEKGADKSGEKEQSKEKAEEKGKSRDRDHAEDKDKEREKGRDREKDRDRDRDSTKDKERDKDRGKERNKEQNKDKERDKDRERDKDGGKEQNKDRKKGGSRSRSRSRDRGRERRGKDRRSRSRSAERKRGKSRSRSRGKTRKDRSRSRSRDRRR